MNTTRKTKLAIVDFNRTLFDPDTGSLIPGAREMLEALRERDIRIVLVSKREGGREQILKQLGIAHFFDEMLFVEEKTPQMLRALLVGFECEAGECIVIGDYIYSEIRSGNDIGAKTIRYKAGKFADLAPLQKGDFATHEVADLRHVLAYIE